MGVFGVLFWCPPQNTIFLVVSELPVEKTNKIQKSAIHTCVLFGGFGCVRPRTVLMYFSGFLFGFLLVFIYIFYSSLLFSFFFSSSSSSSFLLLVPCIILHPSSFLFILLHVSLYFFIIRLSLLHISY